MSREPNPAPGAEGRALEPPPLPLPVSPRPRLWTALVASLIGVVVPGIAGGVAIAIALFASGGIKQVDEAGGFMEWMTAYSARPGGMLVLVLPTQLTMLILALVLGGLSPQPMRQRLGFVRGRLPLRMMPLLMLATPFFGFLGQLLMRGTVGEVSEQLELIGTMTGSQQGAFAVVALLLIGVLPALSEETLFRGYVQRRLLERWSPPLAIGVSTLIFAAAHLDPGHLIAVLPLGIWLGVVAWRSDATWPAMLCHGAQNTLFTMVSLFIGFDGSEEPELRDMLIVMALPGLAALFSLFVLRRMAAAKA